MNCLIVNGQSISDTSIHKNKWRIGLNFSPDYCFRKLDSTNITNGNPPNVRYTIMHYRDSIERAKFGFTAGISIGYDINQNISLESGIFYSDKGYQTMELGPFNGSNISIGGVKLIYSYNYIDIPLMVDATFINYKKFSIGINVGIVLDMFLNAYSTSVLDNNSNTTTTSKDNNDYNKINISIMAGFNFNYKINSKFSIKLEPTYRYGMIRIIDAPITAYLWNAGVNIGIDYHF
jgi:opacity protein-like surface antigen